LRWISRPTKARSPRKRRPKASAWRRRRCGGKRRATGTWRINAQKQADAEGAWAHAYLHRVEGDLRNAGGWYSRAGRPASTAPLKEEWETIARALLG
jgi:hypothetical protein